MSDKEDRKLAKKTLKTAKKGSAAHIEAMGILSGDDPEKREYRKTTRNNNNNKTNPYKDMKHLDMIFGTLAKNFPETAMDIEDAIGFGKIYEGAMKGRGRKSLKKTDEDYSGDRPTKKKMGGGKVYKKMGGGYMKKKMAGGGPLKTVDVKNNPGLAKLPTPVRNKMGFAKDGGKVYNKKHGGKVIKNNMSGQDLVNACYDN